jgi:hypothetical protein
MGGALTSMDGREAKGRPRRLKLNERYKISRFM